MVHWSWNLPLGVIVICLWAISKPDIHICFPCRFVEGRYDGAGSLFRLSCFNWLLCLIWNVLQVLLSILLLLIVDLCVSYLLDQIPLILKIIIGCDCKLSVGLIQNRHMYLLSPQVCGSPWLGCRFLIFYLSPSMHWLSSRQFLNFVIFWWIVDNWFINTTEYCWFYWGSG